MLKPDFGFHERQLSNVYVLTTAANAGTIMTADATDATVVGVGDCSYGKVVAGSISVDGDREYGPLYYDVTTNGPSFFNVVSGVMDLSTAVNGPVVVWHAPGGAVYSTDAFLASGTGSLTVGAGSGNTAQGSLLGIKNGQFVLASAFTATNPGSVARAKLVGNALVDGVQCVRVQVL